MRVHELAKELGVPSKELVERCQTLGLAVKSHANSITDEEAERLRGETKPASKAKPARKKTAKPKTAKKKVAPKAATTKKSATKTPAKKMAAKKTDAKKATGKETTGTSKLKFKKGGVKKRILRITRKKTGTPTEAQESGKAAGTATWTGRIEKTTPREEPKPVEVEKSEKLTAKDKLKKKSKALPEKHKPSMPKRESKVKVLFRPEEGKEAPVSRGRIKGAGKAVGRIKLEEEAARARRKRVVTKGRDEWRTTAMRTLVDDTQERSRRGGRRGGFRRVKVRGTATVTPRPTEVELVSPVTIKDLSAAMGIRANQLIGKLMSTGVMASINHILDDEAVQHLAEEFGVKVELKAPKDITAEFIEEQRSFEDKPEDVGLRAPVVTFMGHVDHGKTSLLDAIRKANVVSTESGGITQHIGAYRVNTSEGRAVVFLDTPGHEAFTEMRARGANVTDVIVLVVAADDGVMPQTEEAINHARAAGVPIVVAINKVDRPNANVMRVKQQLSNFDLQPEEWGGSTVVVETSAITEQGLTELVEMLSLEAELLELKANLLRPAEGTVLEARLSEGRGSMATVLIQNGTLHVGDGVLCGVAYGRVRAIYDDRGQPLEEAGASMPVSVLGLSEGPEAGDSLYAVDDLVRARGVAEARARKSRQADLTGHEPITLENLFEHLEAGRVKELRVILKADVKGSIEVLRSSIEKLSTSEVKVHVLHAAVGAVSESDVLLAHASDAIVIGFHVAPDDRARILAQDKGVEIRLYQVIYQVTEEVKKALEGLLEPEHREVSDGHVEVREVFKVSRLGTVAGCYVTDGVIQRNSNIRVFRDGIKIYEGQLESLRRFKDDAKEVREGFECGLRIGQFDDIKVADTVEAYHIEEIARKLD